MQFYKNLKRARVRMGKIDKMFVEGLPEDSSMIAAIIMLAQSLNLQMIAEGVETEAKLMIEVVPPRIAAFVPLSKSSAVDAKAFVI